MAAFDPYLAWLGVPAHQRPPTYYQLLGVDPAITDANVVKTLALQRIAYVRNFQRSEHADVCARILEELARAESVLTDAVQRAAYDRSLKPAEPIVFAQPVPAKAAPAKVIAVPATHLQQSSPPRRTRKSRAANENMEAVKWTVGAVAVVVVLIAVGSVVRMIMAPSKGTIAVAFEGTWSDAKVLVDGKGVPLKGDGALAELPPGEYTVEVDRGELGRFATKVQVVTGQAADVRVPSSSFTTREVLAARPLVAKLRPIPADATATLKSGAGTLTHEPPMYSLTANVGGFTAGVELEFSKEGYLPKSVRIGRAEAESGRPIDVTMEKEKKKIAYVSVSPLYADVSVRGGEAKSEGNGRWTVTGPLDLERTSMTVSAGGFTTRRIETPLDGSTTSVALRASPVEALKYYQAQSDGAALKLIGRATGFGWGVGQIALSRNGKFLAVAERETPTQVHVWDVEKAKFIGPALDVRNPPDKSRAPNNPAVSLTVSNDGRYVAVSCFVLCIFDTEEGKEIQRIGKDVRENVPADILEVEFNGDGTKLYSVLRDGRFITRDVATWKINGSGKGVGPEVSMVRFDGDGKYAIGARREFGSHGAFIWMKENEKGYTLDLGPQLAVDPSRFSGKPEFDHFSVTPLPALSTSGSKAKKKASLTKEELDEIGKLLFSKNLSSEDLKEIGEKLEAAREKKAAAQKTDSSSAKPPDAMTAGTVQVRRYDDPGKVWKSVKDGNIVYLVEALTPNHTAVGVIRRTGLLGFQSMAQGTSDWASRIWDVNTGKLVADAGLPSTIYRMTSSDDGQVIATVAEREHAVYLWRFNPKGRLDERFASVVWDTEPSERWSGSGYIGDAKKSMSLIETDGVWKLKVGDQETQLKRKTSTSYVQIFEGGGLEHHFFNSGWYWTKKEQAAGEKGKTYYKPDADGGRLRESIFLQRGQWDDVCHGAWHSDGSIARVAEKPGD